MEKTMAQEIQRLKEELDRKRKEIEDIKELANTEIDRSFPLDLEEFSERELETYIAESIASIKEEIDTRPAKKPITSHRKVIGRPIVSLKRFLLQSLADYNDLFLDQQIRFNRHSIDLYQAVLLRTKHNKERMKQIQEQISACEESLVVLKAKLEDLRASLEQGENPDKGPKLPVKD
jgi:regulator of replication initiation timing